jgi:HNH endonuclease/AP2 domain
MATRNLTPERLREILHYDPATGLFTWRVCRHHRTKIGAIAGCITNGYGIIVLDGSIYKMHRLAWAYTYGHWPKNDIDHIDGNGTNNRLLNLRDATRSMNCQNQKRAQKNNKTGLLGVRFRRDNGRYSAQIGVDGKPRYLGLFDTAEAAHAAYIEAKRRLHPGNML